MLRKQAAASGAVISFTFLDLYCFDHPSVIISMKGLSYFVFGTGPSISSAMNSNGPLPRKRQWCLSDFVRVAWSCSQYLQFLVLSNSSLAVKGKYSCRLNEFKMQLAPRWPFKPGNLIDKNRVCGNFSVRSFGGLHRDGLCSRDILRNRRLCYSCFSECMLHRF